MNVKYVKAQERDSSLSEMPTVMLSMITGIFAIIVKVVVSQEVEGRMMMATKALTLDQMRRLEDETSRFRINDKECAAEVALRTITRLEAEIESLKRELEEAKGRINRLVGNGKTTTLGE